MRVFLWTCVLAAAVFCLQACFNVTAAQAFKNNIAEVVYNKFEAENSDFFVTFESGKREEPYIKNGKAAKLIDFGVITVTVLRADLKETELNYEFYINEKKYSGKLEVNPFDGTRAADIKKIAADDAVLKLKIIWGNKSSSCTLSNVLEDGAADYKEIMAAGQKALSAEIKALTKNGIFGGEIYVRLIGNVLNNKEARPLWFVGITTREGKSYAVIINPQSRDIVAKT